MSDLARGLKSLATAVIALALAHAAPAGQPAPLTQRRINEYAAACITAQLGLRGLKGVPLTGETPTQFAARARGYLAAVGRASRDLAPFRRVPAIADRTPANLQRWERIAALCKALPQQRAVAERAWQDYPRLKQRAQLGPRLLRCLSTIQAVLNLLRDARP